MTYDFKYKRYFWKTLKNVKGHQHILEADRMDVFLADGILSISSWSKCDLKLGNDFILSQKEQMEREAGQAVPVQTEK